MNSRLVDLVRRHVADPLHRNSYFLVLNTGVVTVSGFAFWLVAAKLSPAETIGIATAGIGALTMLSLIGRLGLDVALLRFLPGLGPLDSQRIFWRSLSLASLASLTGAVGYGLGANRWSPALAELASRPVYLIGFAILCMIWTQGALLDSFFTGKRRADFTFYKNSLYSVFRVALLVILGAFLSTATLMVALVGSMLVASLLAFALWARKAINANDLGPKLPPKMSELLRSSASNYAVALLMTAPLPLGSLVVIHRFGPVDAAIFYILWMFGSIGMIVPSAFGQSTLVELGFTKKGGTGKQIRGGLLSAGASAAAIVAGWLLLPRLGEEYQRVGLLPLVPFALAALPGLVLQVRMAELRFSGRNIQLVGVAFSTVAVFLGGFLVIGTSVRDAGWFWLAGLVAGSLTASLLMLNPRKVGSPSADYVPEMIEHQ